MDQVMRKPKTGPGAPPATGAGLAVPDMSVVLVCWNNKAYLEPCLESLYNGGLHYSFDVVVVDNGSTDGSQAMLKEKFPQVKLIQNHENVGLGRASNQGIEATKGRHVLLLNNDTLLNGPSLDALIEFLDTHPHAAAVGGRLLNADGSVQSCYNRFPTLWEEFLIATRLGEWLYPGYPAIIDDDQPRSVSWLGSACLLLRRAALDQVGLLDESYFIYGDEADLQYRLKCAGWTVHYLPQAEIIHYGGRSMDRWRRRKMVYRGKLLFFQKNYGPMRTRLLRILLGTLSAAKLVVWMGASLTPRWREQAQKELASNREVIALCWKLA
jgi:GT2 family glycosyltransferase